jgi:hypothetical protein
MNKIDRYDARKLTEAKKLIQEVAEYNYTSDSNPLWRKFSTIISKLDNILNNELEPELQEEYKLSGRI